ncbi:transposase [Alkalicoccus saliphilus]|uniref:Transposase n=2 Tax=Alkalicoccus saliphilus TaxID=200989 RepID=A0A2T4U261_9BACI|nr:transposase [Alkalicoccus saliphilus]
MWIQKYQTSGPSGLQPKKTWKPYPEAVKSRAVDDFLQGRGSQWDICKTYHLSSPSVLRRWIRAYTEGKNDPSPRKGRSPMTNGRPTTFKERLEIVRAALARDKDYQHTAEAYEVSYQQVYSWVRKYEAQGETGLQDRRGKNLESREALTDEEKLKQRIRELEHRTQYLETENGLLKKWKEIERRDRRS